MERNVANQKVTLLAVTASTGLPKTGDASNLTFFVKKDTGTVTALADTSASEDSATNSPGAYTCDVSQTETDFKNANFSGKSSTSGVVVLPWLNVASVPPNFSLQSLNASGQGDVIKFAGQTLTVGAGVTVPSVLASTTNITAGTLTTVTNLTNAPTAGDFTAVMKTSITTAASSSTPTVVAGSLGAQAKTDVTTAATAATPIAASVTGAVGSVASVVNSNVTKVNGTTITGSGTTPDPWGPV